MQRIRLLCALALALLIPTVCAMANPFDLLVHRGSPNNFFMDAQTPQGWGGAFSGLTPGATITGTNASSFAVDGIGQIVPANGGTITYNSAWSAPTCNPCNLVIGGVTYPVTTRANALEIASPDASSGDQLGYSVGGPFGRALGKAVPGYTVWLRSSIYNPTGAAAYFEPPSLATWNPYPGILTYRSLVVDNSLDANGNPNLKHGFVDGGMYFAPVDATSNYPIVYRDFWFYMNVPHAITGGFLTSSGDGGGWSLFNSRIENGPLYDWTQGDHQGIAVRGNCDIEGNHFLNLSNLAIQVNSLAVPGTCVIANNVFENIHTDVIDYNGSHLLIADNINFGYNIIDPVDHGDFFQSGGSTVYLDWQWLRNFTGNDISNSGAHANSCFFGSDQTAGSIQVTAKNNICYVGSQWGYVAQKADHPIFQYNDGLFDPFMNMQAVTTNVAIANQQAGGINGGQIDHNIINAISIGNQSGVLVTTPNLVIDTSALSMAQVYTRYLQIFPNLVNNQTDAKWKNRAGWIYMFTPGDTPLASGGAVELDGTVDGTLFPACPGQTNRYGAAGALNDGSVFHVAGGYYACNDNTWLAAHPVAS